MKNRLAEAWRLPAVRLAPFWGAGLAAAYFLSGAAAAVLAAFAAAALAALLIRKSAGAVCAAGFSAGLAVMWLVTALYCAPIEEYRGETAQVELFVCDIDSRSSDYSVYIAKTTLNGRSALVRLYGNDSAEIGDRLTATVSFKRADESEYRIRNLSRGIMLTGTIKEITRCERSGFSILRTFYGLRDRFIGMAKRYLGGEEGALASAMFFGESGGLSVEMREALCVSGASHFAAVSGTHFAVLSMLLMQLISEKNRIARGLISLLFVPMAALFFGLSASVLRSAIMVLLCSSAPLFKRRAETLNSLCAAFLLITAANPLAVLDAGLLMSVLGVFGVISGDNLGTRLAGKLPERIRLFSGAVRAFFASFGASVCTLPVAVGCFGGFSLLSAITSVILMPLFPVEMALTLIIGITGTGITALPAALLLRLSGEVIRLLGSLRSFWLPTDFRGAVLVAALCAAGFVRLAYFPEERKSARRWFAAACGFMLAMCLYAKETRCRIAFVSDGSSGAAVICEKDEAAVYIAGTGGRLASRLAECLRENGAVRIRFIAAQGLDFSGALALGELTEIVPAETIYADEDVREVLQRNCAAEISALSPDSVSVDGMTIAADKAGGGTSADIVLYYGYTRSEPKNAAGTAVYLSSRQEIMPQNGVNAYDMSFSLELSYAENIVVNGKVE